MKKLSLNKIIDRSKLEHDNVYSYPLKDFEKGYENINSKLAIICNNHGLFFQTAKNHLNGQGCPKCAVNIKKKQFTLKEKDFLKKAVKKHGLRYGYLYVKYLGSHKNITVTCFKHGNFTQKPYVHLQKHGCPKCGIETAHNKTSLRQEQFENQANHKHDFFFSYEKSTYTNRKNNIIITCPMHGDFIQKAGDHLNGHGCLKCGYNKAKHVRISKGQKNLFDFIKKQFKTNQILLEKHVQIDNNNFCYIDIFIPEKNLVIEYYGDYWHCNPKKYKPDYYHPHKKMHAKEIWAQDKERIQKLKDLNYKTCIIWEYDFKHMKEKTFQKLFNLFKK